MNVFQNYIDGLKMAGRATATIRLYEKDVNKFVNFFGISESKELDVLTVSDFQRLYQSLSATLTPKSLNSFIRSLSALFTWLKDGNYVNGDHAFFHVKFGKTKFVKEAHKKKTILSREESIALIKVAKDIQDKFMLALMLSTALRRDEICQIKLSDISNCNIRITGKGDKERVTKMSDVVCNMFSIYMAVRVEKGITSDYLFYAKRGIQNFQLNGQSVNNRVKTYVKECVKNGSIDAEKAKKITAHRLRGTVITEVAHEFGIHAAKDLAGHVSINTTMIYVEGADEETARIIDKRSSIFSDL